MESSYAPFSPIASTSRVPYRPEDSPVVLSSDFGEREEEEAYSKGEGYWSWRISSGGKGKGKEQPKVAEPTAMSDDELAMSPLRSTHVTEDEDDLPPPSYLFNVSKKKRSVSPPLSPETSHRSPRPSSRTSPPPLDILSSQKPVSPALSDASDDVLAAIARPKLHRTVDLASPSPSTSQPSPRVRRSPTPRRKSPSPSPVVAPSPPARSPSPIPLVPAGRSFRTRTAAQLKPFSTEQFRYTKTLLKNGWAGAVVAGPRPVELSAEEMARKKREHEARKKDDLGGWLVDGEVRDDDEEEDSSGRVFRNSGGVEGESEDFGEASQDGLTLLEREARRKDKMSRQVDAALGVRNHKRSRTKSTSPRRHGPSRIDDPGYEPPHIPRVKKKRSRFRDDHSSSPSSDETPRPAVRRPRAESEPPSSSPGRDSRHSKASSRRNRPRSNLESNKNRISKKSTIARADSEPPIPSPLRRNTTSTTSNHKRRRAFAAEHHGRMAKPSKAIHARSTRDGRNALDADILNLPDMDIDSDEDEESDERRVDGESDVPEDDEDEEEEAEEGEEESPKARRSRLRLDAKRQRALGAMLPAVFFKKAKADLKLMEKERELGYSSGSEVNSGDEEMEDSRGNRAKVRTDPNRLDEPMRFNGDAFTDESDDGMDRNDSEEEEVEQQENDAVSSWLQNFAPRKGSGKQGDEGDIVDRFLKRARKPTKRRHRDKTRSAKTKTTKNGKDSGHRSRKGEDPFKSSKEQGKSGKPSSRVTTAHRPGRPRKAVALDTDRSIFVLAGLRVEGNDVSEDDDVIIVPQARPLQARPLPAPVLASPSGPSTEPRRANSVHPDEPEEDVELWASFGKFTPDFDIQRLPVGVQFTANDSFVQDGHLYSLVNPSTASLVSCDVFGITLQSTATAATIESLLPPLVDAIFDCVSTDVTSTVALDPFTGTGRALRFLGSFISTRLVNAPSDDKYRFGSALATQLDHLELRLDNHLNDVKLSPTLRKTRLAISWYAVDLTARLGTISAVGGDSRRLARLVTALVRRLIQHGVDRTLSSLRQVMQESPSVGSVVSDVTVEAWLGLVTLATRTGQVGDSTFDQNDLWDVVLEETVSSLPAKARNGGPVLGEVVSLTSMLLCAISQFSPSGISTSTPRLAAYWPAMMRCLDPIKASSLSAPEHDISSTALSRRDRYLWTLFARCLVFVERWNWTLDIKDDILAKLFDLLASRRLANLSTESVGDFPQFLQETSDFGQVVLDRPNDTAFTIFLKLVISAVRNLPDSTDAEKRKRSTQLTRLAVRLAPMTNAWTRSSPELFKSSSILVNHYSLLLTLAILHPAQASQKVEQARKLILFAEADDEARKTSIRAILFFALAFRHFSLSLDPLLEWLASIVLQLKTEYVDIEKQRRSRDSRMRQGERGDAVHATNLWQRALLITMVLRSIQVICRWQKSETSSPAYPDLALLNPAWTSRLLLSPLALDPMIGREILKTIDCFLDLRQLVDRQALPSAAPEAVQHESQDDYGMDEFDFEDPALNALLGIEGGPPIVDTTHSRTNENDALDQRFAEFIKTTLAQPFFGLVSNIYGSASGSAPTVGDRAAYAEAVVDSWTRCIDVVVSKGLDTWTSYLRYGNYSFKRVPDLLGRLDIGLFLAIRILHFDVEVYTTCEDEILSIWFSSIVSSQLTAQHILTEHLLNLPASSPLFDGAPFERSISNGRIEVEQLDLLDKRIELLRTVFSNAARLATSPSIPGANQLKPSASKDKERILRYLRDLLGAMRTNFSALRDDTSKRTYANLVKDVLAVMNSSGKMSANEKGPFEEANLVEIRNLRTSIANF